MWAYPESQMQFCPHSAHRGESRYEWDGTTPYRPRDLVKPRKGAHV